MSITRAEIKYQVYLLLNKTAATRGFYTDEKCNSAVQQAVDFISAQMFIADDGFTHKLDYLDVVDGAVTVPIPSHMAMILEVRFLLGSVYLPVHYDQRFGDVSWASQSGAVQFPSRYSVIDNQFYFNPAISVGGANALEVQYMAYPRRFTKDTDALESQFDRSMFWYAVFKAASILASSVGQFSKAWMDQEAPWWNSMQQIIFKRNQQMTAIKEFQG